MKYFGNCWFTAGCELKWTQNRVNSANSDKDKPELITRWCASDGILEAKMVLKHFTIPKCRFTFGTKFPTKRTFWNFLFTFSSSIIKNFSQLMSLKSNASQKDIKCALIIASRSWMVSSKPAILYLFILLDLYFLIGIFLRRVRL